MAILRQLCYCHKAASVEWSALLHHTHISSRLTGHAALRPTVRQFCFQTRIPRSHGTFPHGVPQRPFHCLSAAAAAVQQGTSSSPATGERPTQNVVEVLRSRGLIQDVSSPELEIIASQQTFPVYCGFDPTADSLHLGNLLGIVVLRWFAICGHTPVALLGGATGRVGDPSGKSAERPVLSEENIEHNVQSIKVLLEKLLSREDVEHAGSAASLPKPLLLNNLDWFGAMPFLTFLRQVGKYARLGTMLAKDSVRSRLGSENGISFTEFTYQLLQGYDFVHLQREHGCRVQIGGSDQWGNITAGTDLIRRLHNEEDQEAPQCFGLTFPLLVSSDGKKWGKSEGGALWLNPDKMSPFKLYQYLLKNTTDQDVIRYLKMLTFLPLQQIDSLEADMQQPSYKPNTAQRLLAEQVLLFVHGKEGLSAALTATQALQPGAKTALDANTLQSIAGDVPLAQLTRDQVVGQPLIQVMVASGLQPTKAASKRMIKGGGIQLNNERISAEDREITEQDLIEGRLLLLAAGKKNKLLVTVT